MSKHIAIKDFKDIMIKLNSKVWLEKGTVIAIIKGIAGLPRIEVSDDAISREYIVKKLKSAKEFYLSAWEGFSNMDDKDKARCDELDNCIATIINAPPVITPEVSGCPYFIDGVWCNLVGKKMKGADDETI